MREATATTEMAMSDAQTSSEVSSHLSTSVGKSKYSFRLFFFTALSVLACMAALANVASAATPSGEDQYVEKVPTGGGGTKNPATGVDVIDADGNGVVTEAEVKAAAEKKKAKKDKAATEDEGATGATGAVAGSTTPKPPAVESVATAAQFGPLSRSTALILGGLLLLGGVAFAAFGSSGGSFLSGGGGSRGSSPNPPTH